MTDRNDGVGLVQVYPSLGLGWVSPNTSQPKGTGERKEAKRGRHGVVDRRKRKRSASYERRRGERNKASKREERGEENSLLRGTTFPGGGRAYRRMGTTFRFDLLSVISKLYAGRHVNQKKTPPPSFFFSGFLTRFPVTLAIRRAFSTRIFPRQ